MSLFQRLLPSAFKPELPDPAFPLAERFAARSISRFVMAYCGDALLLQTIERRGNLWCETKVPPAPGDPAVALLTPRSLAVDLRELPLLPAGNTEAAYAQAIMDNPAKLLSDYERDRAYHLLALDGRRAMIFSVKIADVQKCLHDLSRAKLKIVHQYCGLGLATKWSIADYLVRQEPAHAIVVHDQGGTLTLGMRGERVESATLINLGGDPAAATQDIRKSVTRATDIASGTNARPTVLFYTTAQAQIDSPKAFTDENCDCTVTRVPSHDLCFA